MSASASPTLRSRATASFSWSVVAKLVSQGATLVGTVVLTRLLPLEAFGLVAMAAVYLYVLQTLIDAGLVDALVQRPELAEDEIASAFWFLLGAGAAGFAVSLAARPYLDALLGTPGIGWIVVAQTTVLLFMPFRTVGQAILSREVRIEELSKRELVFGLLRVAGSIALAFAGVGVWSLVVPMVATEIAFSLSAFLRAGWRPVARFSWPALRPLASYGLDITLSKVAWIGANRADQFLVGRLLGPAALGLYSLAWQFAGMLPQFASATLARVAFPVFARLQGDLERLRGAFLAMTRYAALAALPALTGLALVASDLLGVLLAPAWAPAIGPVQALCPLALFKILESLAGYVINARGATRRNLRYNLLAFAATVVGVSVGARLGGVTGVAVFAGISSIPVSMLFIRAATLECGGTLRGWAGALAGPVRATLAMAAVVVGAGALLPAGSHALRLAALIGVGVASYAAAVPLLAPGILAELRARPRADPAPQP